MISTCNEQKNKTGLDKGTHTYSDMLIEMMMMLIRVMVMTMMVDDDDDDGDNVGAETEQTYFK